MKVPDRIGGEVAAPVVVALALFRLALTLAVILGLRRAPVLVTAAVVTFVLPFVEGHALAPLLRRAGLVQPKETP